MKKSLFFYLFAVICSASLFTSCSDDDDEVALNPIEGTWQLSPLISDSNGSYVSGPLALAWTGEATLEIWGMNIPVETIAPTIETYVNASISTVLTDFTLNKGDFTATVDEASQSAEGIVTYKLSGNNQILLMLDMEGILAKIAGSGSDISIDAETITNLLAALSSDLQSLITNGIPVDYIIAADGNSATFSIDKNLVSKLAPIMPLIAMLLPSDGGDMIDMVKPILTDFKSILNNTEELVISLKVVRPASAE